MKCMGVIVILKLFAVKLRRIFDSQGIIIVPIRSLSPQQGNALATGFTTRSIPFIFMASVEYLWGIDNLMSRPGKRDAFNRGKIECFRNTVFL
jgi:hypothetical protein